MGSLWNSGYTARPITSFPCINMDPTEIAKLIEAGFDGATVRVASDDNTHYEALVIAAEFEGKRPIARHQLVYKCLGSLMGNEIHAMSIRAMTPAEFADQAGGANPIG